PGVCRVCADCLTIVPFSGARRRAPVSPQSSEPLDDGGDRLSEADTHARDAIAGFTALELVDERRSEPRSGRAERVAERDSAAVRIDVLHPLGEPGVAGELEH